MIFYQGPSAIDGKPIVAIATPSKTKGNRKTGNMVQTWIMRSDIEPHTAIKTGDDYSVCGDCPHRNRDCYVLTFQAPLSVYRAFHRGSYVNRTIDQFAGQPLRLGSYGDPLAVPQSAWQPLLDITEGRTGYSHQWNTPRATTDWKAIVMASVDSQAQATKAQTEGWRTFRVAPADGHKASNEAHCPASEEMGRKVKCIDCQACNGQTGRKASIVILAHGGKASKFQEAQMV